MERKINTHFGKSWLIFAGLWFAAFSTFAQQKNLTGTITDSQTKVAIEGVGVKLNPSGKLTLTDKSGRFSLPFDTISPGQTLTFSHLGFETVTLKIKPGQINYSVRLAPKTTTISEVTITSSKKLSPAKVQPETVLDYAISGNRLYVLYWIQNLKNPSLKILDVATDSILQTFPLPVFTKALFVDCLDNLHLLTEDQAYQCRTDADGIFLYPPASRANFLQLLVPCQGIINEFAYFRQDINFGIITSFYAVNQETRQTKLLETILDRELKVMIQSEDRFQMVRTERESGESAGANAAAEGDEVALANNERTKYSNPEQFERRKAFNAEFAQRFLFRPEYVPMLKTTGQICIFDHINGQLKRFHSDSLVKTVAINYHRQKNYARQNLADAVTGKIYALYSKNGLPELRTLNLETGGLENSYKISLPFASKITVHNGLVYFLYKDPGSNYRQFLYKASLNTFL